MSGLSAAITQDIVILNVLKLASFGVTLASTAWCLIRKTTVEDEQGRKRLTPDGYKAIALAIGSFVVACSLQGVETVAKLSERRSGQIEAANAATRDAIREARQSRVEGRQREQLAIQRLARAEALSARAEARVLTLTAAEDARRRDLALARDVNLGTRRNLASTHAALVQLDRLVHPIERLEVKVRWELPLGTEMAELRTAAQQIDVNDPRSWPAWLRGASAEGERRMIEIRPDSPFYPTLDNHREVALAISLANVRVGFFASTYPRASIHPANIPESDLYVQVSSGDAPILTYDIQSHSFIFEMATPANPEIRRTSRMVSSVDLEGSLMAIYFAGTTRRVTHIRDPFRALQVAMTPLTVTLGYSGRSRWFAGDQVTRAEGMFGIPMFTIDLAEQ